MSRRILTTTVSLATAEYPDGHYVVRRSLCQTTGQRVDKQVSGPYRTEAEATRIGSDMAIAEGRPSVEADLQKHNGHTKKYREKLRSKKCLASLMQGGTRRGREDS